MPLQKFLFNPGINKEGTDYTAEGGWYDGNLVRFRKGFAEKIGGWKKVIQTSYNGTGRKLLGWVDLEGTKLLGLGTRTKLYIQEGASFNDITPIRSTTGAGDVTFAASDGSSTLTITDAGHGASKGDFVTFSGAASLGGNVIAAVLNQEYEIVSISSSNAYTITAKDTSGDTVTANSSDSGNGGGSTVGAYQINVGLDVFVDGTGWGAGTWGGGTFGSTSSLSDLNQLRLWSLDSFGEDLISCPRAGGIYYWDVSAKTLGTDRAVPLTELSGANLAPTKGLQVLVSDVDRHVVVLGADPISDGSRSGSIDPLLIAFSDQENAAVWEPKSTNTAGSLRCSAGSEIIGGLRARQETLIWTDVALYSMQFIGTPLTFGLNLINEGVSLIGPNAAINTPSGVFWMDKKGFYNYTGAVSPVTCSVHSYVFDDLEEGQAYQAFAFLNKQFNEVGWFYCSTDATSIDKYVVYNYVEQTWNIGALSRTAWLDEGIVAFPRAAGKSSTTPYLYQHETGNDADGSPMDDVYIESADFDIGEGEDFQFIKRMIPDVKFTGNGGSDQQINVVLKQRNYPASSLSTDQTSSFTASTTKIDMRARARQAALRFESDDDASVDIREGVGFRIGGTRLDIKPNGRR
jgi:hypothetical protein|tara:strand:- start:111 stop:2000 length:1890 start_codon:yes stop_codon:yes gene_type:complete